MTGGASGVLGREGVPVGGVLGNRGREMTITAELSDEMSDEMSDTGC